MFKRSTVKPVLSGPVLNGHPLLSGQLQKSGKFLLLTTLNVTSIKRSPLLSGRGSLLQSPARVFLLFSPVLSGHFIKGNHTNVCGHTSNQKQLFILTNDREM